MRHSLAQGCRQKQSSVDAWSAVQRQSRMFGKSWSSPVRSQFEPRMPRPGLLPFSRVFFFFFPSPCVSLPTQDCVSQSTYPSAIIDGKHYPDTTSTACRATACVSGLALSSCSARSGGSRMTSPASKGPRSAVSLPDAELRPSPVTNDVID